MLSKERINIQWLTVHTLTLSVSIKFHSDYYYLFIFKSFWVPLRGCSSVWGHLWIKVSLKLKSRQSTCPTWFSLFDKSLTATGGERFSYSPQNTQPIPLTTMQGCINYVSSTAAEYYLALLNDKSAYFMC